MVADDAEFLTLDDDVTRNAAQSDPLGFVERAGERTLVIDEIQRMPSLALALKSSIDQNRRPGRFLLTGSASLLRMRGLPDSLAGRAVTAKLFGLSMGERTGQRDDFVAGVMKSAVVRGPSQTPTRAEYLQFLAEGGYPEVTGLSERNRMTWLTSYVDRILRRDLDDLGRGIDPRRVEALLRALAGNQANEVVKARLTVATGIPAATINRYVDLLADVHLIAEIPPWTTNLTKRETRRAKGLVLDSALALRVARLSPGQLAEIAYGEAFGRALEAFVVAELLKQQTWSSEDFELFHYRDRTGDEVDLVIELTGGRVIGVEVKASLGFGGRDFKHLENMRNRLGERFVAGFVLNTGERTFTYGDRLHGLPIAALWSGVS